MKSLDSIVPIELRLLAKQSGIEFLYPYPAILEVVRLANQHDICILGVEIFQILPNGFLTEAISDHGVKVKGEWTDFCARNNAMASEFIDHHRKDEGLGYILTTASREEYKKLGLSL